MITLYFRSKKLAWCIAKGVNENFYHIYGYGKVKGEKPYYIIFKEVR